MPNRDPARIDRPGPAPADSPEEATGAIGDAIPSRTECFEVSRLSLVYRYLLLFALTVIGVFLLYILVPMALSGRDYLIGALLAVWGLALLRYWAFLLAMPHRICLEGGELLVFQSLFRERKINCNQIVALRVSPFYQSYLRIITSRKKTIPLLNHVDGLNDLIARIKRINPDLETKGC